MSLIDRAMRWLDRAPVRDALDRRSSAGLQIVLMLASVVLPLALASNWLENRELGPGMRVGIGASLGLWICFWLLRRGHFQTAGALLYSGLLALILVSYQSYGLRAHAGFQLAHLLPLLLGGLLLGRAALWGGLAVLLLALSIGAGVDLSGSGRGRSTRRPDGLGADHPCCQRDAGSPDLRVPARPPTQRGTGRCQRAPGA